MSRPMSKGVHAPAIAGIVVIAGLCYLNSFQGSFHYDDYHSIRDNPSIRMLANATDFFTDPSMFSVDTDKSMYRPLLLLTYALNHAVGEYAVFGYHLVNIVLHACCALLCWGASWLLFAGMPERGRMAALAGLLFAAYPLAAEPVNYISGRSDLLSTLFYLAAFVLHLRWRQQGILGAARSPRWYAFGAASLLCFAAGLLAKSTVITLPAVLILADWLILTGPGQRRRALATVIPYHAGYWVVAVAYVVLLRSTDFLQRSLSSPVREWGTQLLTQIKVPAYYLKLIVFPVGLNVEHQFSESSSIAAPAVWLAGLLVLSIAVVGWVVRCRRVAVFPVVWAIIVILPVSVMPLNVLVNERRLYLVLVAFAWSVALLLGSRLRRLFYVWIAVLCLSVLQRNEVWATETSLWEDAAAKAPRMYRVQTNLGKALQLEGRDAEAMAAYHRAIDIDPRHGDAYNNIGILHHRQGRVEEAIAWYLRAVERYPDYEEIYQNLADAYSDLGDRGEARAWYEKALSIDERRGSVWANYGELLFQLGDLTAAERAATRAIDLLPGQAEPYNNLGNVHAERGEYAAALAMYEKALSLEPAASGEIHANIGDTYLDMGRPHQARAALQRALALDPDNARIHLTLGRVAQAMGADAEARGWFEAAVALAPENRRNHAVLAELLAANGEHGEAIAAFQTAIAVDSTYGRALFGLARSYEAVGRRPAAAAAYDRFLEVWPHRDARKAAARKRLRELAP